MQFLAIQQKYAELVETKKKIRALEVKIELATNELNFLKAKKDAVISLQKLNTPKGKIIDLLDAIDHYYYR